MAQTALAPKSQTSATSLNDEEFAHPVIFGVFVGRFCDMSMQKLAILTWPMLTFYQFGSSKSLPHTKHNYKHTHNTQ
jgi:hypothetical protein